MAEHTNIQMNPVCELRIGLMIFGSWVIGYGNRVENKTSLTTNAGGLSWTSIRKIVTHDLSTNK
eukprot:5987284-Amphidinium_carterae.1